MRIEKITALLLIMAHGQVMACFARPLEPFVPYQLLVARTNNIVLAENVKFETIGEYWGKYHFKLIRAIKGKPPVNFIIEGMKNDNSTFKSVHTTYKNHSKPVFWAKGGRSLISTSCKVEPVFKVGKIYLIFLDRPYHISSFERIESENDLWLQTIELLTGT